VTASNPQSAELQISSWSDTAINAFLPASFGVGIAQIGVTTANGYASINIMAGTAAAPPAISLSAYSLDFAFAAGGTTPAEQSVSVANAGGGSLTYSVASNAPWLIASASGNVISVSVDPTGLTADAYQGAITVASAVASNSPQTISVTFVVTGAPPTVIITSVRNSATGLTGAIAPGELVSIFGTGLGPSTAATFSVNPATGMVDTALAGTQVFFGSMAAPIL
jgi:hypothetical protein